MPNEIIQSLCNACGHETDHEVISQETVVKALKDSPIFLTKSRAVCCRGCRELALRKETWTVDSATERDPAGEPESINFQPARLWRRPPTWVDDLEAIDVDLKGLLDEVYLACNDQQVRLLSMGVRSALDHVMTLILGGDVGSFEQKLDAMVTADHLSPNQRENIGVVIDAGSASSHRGFRPARQLVEEMVVVMENIVREHYITGPMMQTARTMIPPRPPRQTKPVP